MKVIIQIGIILLLLANIMIFISMKRNSYKENPYNTNIMKLPEENTFANKYNYSKFPLDIKVTSTDGKTMPLQNIIKENTIVMWYPQHNCTLCLRNSLEQFLQTAKYLNSILLSTYLTPRDLIFFSKKYNISIPCFSIKEINPPFKNWEVPVFFNLAPNGIITNIWVHNPEFENISTSYFEMQLRQNNIEKQAQ